MSRKVFQVITECCEEDKTITTMERYVTSDLDSLKSVTDYYTVHCVQLELELKSVREVLVISEHVPGGDI